MRPSRICMPHPDREAVAQAADAVEGLALVDLTSVAKVRMMSAHRDTPVRKHRSARERAAAILFVVLLLVKACTPPVTPRQPKTKAMACSISGTPAGYGKPQTLLATLLRKLSRALVGSSEAACITRSSISSVKASGMLDHPHPNRRGQHYNS